MELNAVLKEEVEKLWAAIDAPAPRGLWFRLASLLRGLMV